MGVTRDLACFATNRTAGYLITLNYSTKVLQNDGSYVLTAAPTSVMADVVDLSEDQIQRLQEGGITINNGISISIPSELPKIPDTITFGQDTYTIMQDVISENTTVLTCSRKPIGTSLVEAGA